MSKENLICGLNEDLAAELGTAIRYTYQAANWYGLLVAGLRELLLREAQDELGHAAFLMEAIQDLGGEPTTTPKSFEKPTALKKMLEFDVKMEAENVANYRAHAKLAEQLGLHELKTKLEEMAAAQAGHGRELRRVLKGLYGHERRSQISRRLTHRSVWMGWQWQEHLHRITGQGSRQSGIYRLRGRCRFRQRRLAAGFGRGRDTRLAAGLVRRGRIPRRTSGLSSE